MMSTKVPKAAQNQLDLSISHVCKFLKKSEAQNILSHYADKLAVAQTPAEKVYFNFNFILFHFFFFKKT